MAYDKDAIERMTLEYGGEWGLQHARRVARLAALIAGDEPYNAEAVWLAAQLHDWGGYDAWVQEGVPHPERSAQVAEGFLRQWGCPEEVVQLAVESIRLHDVPGEDRSREAALLRDADLLDFLGVCGVLREFSRNPRQLRRAFEAARRRRDEFSARLSLPRARQIAAQRVKAMDDLLAAFEEETGGNF